VVLEKDVDNLAGRQAGGQTARQQQGKKYGGAVCNRTDGGSAFKEATGVRIVIWAMTARRRFDSGHRSSL